MSWFCPWLVCPRFSYGSLNEEVEVSQCVHVTCLTFSGRLFRSLIVINIISPRYFEEKIKRLEEDSHQEMEEVMSRALASMEESKTMEEKLASISKEKAKAETRE